MKTRIIEVRGFKVEVWNFGYASFYYPAFNGNAEFEVSAKGFRKLCSYLGLIKWIKNHEALAVPPKQCFRTLRHLSTRRASCFNLVKKITDETE